MPYYQHILYHPPVALLFSMFINENFQVKLLPCEYNRQISANTKGGRWAKYFRWESQRKNSQIKSLLHYDFSAKRFNNFR